MSRRVDTDVVKQTWKWKPLGLKLTMLPLDRDGVRSEKRRGRAEPLMKDKEAMIEAEVRSRRYANRPRITVKTFREEAVERLLEEVQVVESDEAGVTAESEV